MPWTLPTPSSEEDAAWSAIPPPPPPPPRSPRQSVPSRRPKATATTVARAFDAIDANGNGVLSRAEVIKALRDSEEVRTLLGLPAQIHDETREVFENVFQKIDADGSKSIDKDEFHRFFMGDGGRVKIDAPAALANSLLMMGPATAPVLPP